MITAVYVNGSPLDLDAIELAVAIDHGRNDITQSPQPSTAEMTIRSTSAIPVEISDLIEIETYTDPRFQGRVSDRRITHEKSTNGTYVARTTITAMGNLSLLGLLEVGTTGFAEETLDDRVRNILDETGLIYTANTDPGMVLLAAAAAEGQTANSVLTDICQMTGATMCDLPDGAILFESYTRRGYGYNPSTWAMVGDPWSAIDSIWSDIYERTDAAPTPVTMNNNGVIWEPVWSVSILPVVNRAIVTYGDTSPQSTITIEDTASQVTHGLRAAKITTNLADLTDAYDRAQHVISCQSEPRDGLTQVQILVDDLAAPLRAQVLDLIQGDRVLIQNIPQPAPDDQYMGVVEGWTDSYTESGHVLTLSLSDPRFSYAMATWDEVSPSLAWSGVSLSIQWYNVVVPSDLAA